MLIAWDNKADAATLAASSELASLPGANVQQPHLSRKWSTAAGVSSAALTLNLGSSLACAQLAVLGTNLTSASTLRLRASDADPTAVAGDKLDTGAVSAAVKDGYGSIYKNFNSVTARYWRLDLTDGTLTQLQAGRLFLGPNWQPSFGMLYGWSVTAQDPSKVSRSYGGQSFPEVLPQRRVLNFELNFLSESEMYSNAFAMARAQGIVKDVLAIPLETGARISEQSVWGLLSAAQPLIHDKSQIFRQKFQIEERL
jgi:hypothetical protein